MIFFFHAISRTNTKVTKTKFILKHILIKKENVINYKNTWAAYFVQRSLTNNSNKMEQKNGEFEL